MSEITPPRDRRAAALKGWRSTHRANGSAAQVEQTAQGAQLVIPGAERSAHQAAAARDGRMRARKPQQEPGGPLFSYIPPQPSLFDK